MSPNRGNIFDFDREPEFIAGQLEGNVLDALAKHTDLGVNGSASYQGKNQYLMVGMSGKLREPLLNNEQFLKIVIAKAAECPKSNVAVSFENEIWFFAVHLTRETNQS